MFGLGTLFYCKIGWSTSSSADNAYLASSPVDGSIDSIKSRLVNLIGATRTLLRFPLIIINVVVILYELVLG
ncbi:hypothetical protein OGATHE_003471 [Ogataea polymorpha]|uniref:Yos1-like protein n=1 Tax=Ogataea polymorpha TaxID=460523 RepID=A0A9P8T4A6_9ASCO|nr:hypothetical protein OGATHE_003471 [Ogataea polymorpha]